MCVKLMRAKFQRPSARGTFSNWRLDEGGYEIQLKQVHVGPNLSKAHETRDILSSACSHIVLV